MFGQVIELVVYTVRGPAIGEGGARCPQGACPSNRQMFDAPPTTMNSGLEVGESIWSWRVMTLSGDANEEEMSNV